MFMLNLPLLEKPRQSINFACTHCSIYFFFSKEISIKLYNYGIIEM